MEKGEFFEFCKEKGYSDKDISIFKKAIEFTEDKYEGRIRNSGGAWSYHNMMVGKILVDIKSDPDLVTAGLLHSLEIFHDEIIKEFGKEVYAIVRGLSEIKEIKNKNSNLQAEAVKKILMTTMTDIRILIVKLANEVDNFRNIENLPKEKQLKIANEALEIYAPLAYRLGNEKIRFALENSAFKIINPKKYFEIENYLKATNEQREKQVSEAIDEIKKALDSKVKIIQIKGRPKHIYSIYKKTLLKEASISKQLDLLGIRIIAKDTKDCYSILANLHEEFTPVEGKLKDYIANPKPNNYQSIHTIIEFDNGRIAEVQIRTKEMDELAEEGLAAHWMYKGLKGNEAFEKKVGWLKAVLQVQKTEGNKEFLEAAKVDVFSDKIYCYTPKGDVKELPVGASLLDFAFMIHEQVGYKAIGGKVNGKFVPLRHTLEKGDVIEIITNKNQRPHRNWFKIIKTTGARHKIRRALKEHENLAPIHYRIPKLQIAKSEQVLLVESKEFANALCQLAKCCNPIPGDEICGIPTKRRIISTHRKDCKQALKEEKRWTKVNWKDSVGQKIKFVVHAIERSGVLADILHNIANSGFEVSEAKAKLQGDDVYCSITIVPRSLENIVELIKRLKKIKNVKRIVFES